MANQLQRAIVVALIFVCVNFFDGVWVKLRQRLAPAEEAQPEPTPETRALTSDSSVNVIAELYEAVTWERLQKLANDNIMTYGPAVPFPHIVIDGIFPESFLKVVSEEIAEARAPARGFRNGKENQKSTVAHEANMGMVSHEVFKRCMCKLEIPLISLSFLRSIPKSSLVF